MRQPGYRADDVGTWQQVSAPSCARRAGRGGHRSKGLGVVVRQETSQIRSIEAQEPLGLDEKPRGDGNDDEGPRQLG